MPLATRTATAVSATVEKRLTDAASTDVRSSGANRRVAAGRASRSSATPPTHTAMATTCRKLAGTSTQAGSSVAAWPASAGVRQRNPSRTTKATAATREACGARSRSSTATISQADSLRPQTVPKRVCRTSSITPGSSALHSDVPPAIAPWKQSPSADMAAPSPAARSSRSRVRRAKAARACVRPSPVGPAASAGRHTARTKTTAPAASASARYDRARTTPKPTSVTSPAPPVSISWSRVSAGVPPRPTVKTKPPTTGCESAETTR